MRNTCPPPVSNALEAQVGLLRRGRRGGIAGRWQAGSGSLASYHCRGIGKSVIRGKKKTEAKKYSLTGK